MMKQWFSVVLFAVATVQAQSDSGGMVLKNMGKALGLPAEFFARVEIVTGAGGEGDMVMNSRMYVGKDAMRYEMDMPGGFGIMTTLALTEGELTKVYMLSPKQKVYSKLPDSPKQEYTEEQIKITDQGDDSIEGIPCLKKNVTDPQGKVMSIWLRKENNLPVQFALEEKGMQVRMIFKEFKAGPVDPELLKIPADYRQGSPFSGFMNLNP